MAHDKVYGICENKCFVEVYDKETPLWSNIVINDSENAFVYKGTARYYEALGMVFISLRIQTKKALVRDVAVDVCYSDYRPNILTPLNCSLEDLTAYITPVGAIMLGAPMSLFESEMFSISGWFTVDSKK